MPLDNDMDEIVSLGATLLPQVRSFCKYQNRISTHRLCESLARLFVEVQKNLRISGLVPPQDEGGR